MRPEVGAGGAEGQQTAKDGCSTVGRAGDLTWACSSRQKFLEHAERCWVHRRTSKHRGAWLTC